MNEFQKKLLRLMKSYGVGIRPPVNRGEIERAEHCIGPMPPDLIALYQVTNGFQFEWFKILPIEDTTRIKHTWDSIQRANSPQITDFVGLNSELLERFLIFGDIGVRNATLIDRTDFSIWYDEGEIYQTNMGLWEFIDTVFREVHDM